MRSYDLWNKYLDNDNNPLHGCVQFNVKDGNTVAPIYDSDGQPIDNPQITDIYGRTQHQVFVDKDVIAYFYKYVGSGSWQTETDIDTSDVSKWELQYTVESQMEINIDVTGNFVPGVNTIDDLRVIDIDTVNTVNGNKFITLMGYYEVGDKEPINYIWNPESMEPDNGGSVISTGLLKGRWIMIRPTEHLDVRHFGVFPSNSTNMNDQSDQVANACTYANNNGLRLYFGINKDNQEYKYYKMYGVTIYPTHTIDFSNGVIVLDNNLTIRSYAEQAIDGQVYFSNNDTVLYSDIAYASYNVKELYKSVEGAECKFIVDANDSGRTLTGYNVIVNKDISNYALTNCNVSGSGNITSSAFLSCELNVTNIGVNCQFGNCKLTELIFANKTSGTPVSADIQNCIIDINDFTHNVSQYVYLKWRSHDDANIDFNFEPLPADQSFTVNGGDHIYTNAVFNNNVLSEAADGPHVYRYINCYGTLRIFGNNSNNTYEFDNCTLNVTFSDRNKVFTINCNNSTIAFNNDGMMNTSIAINGGAVALAGKYKSITANSTTLISNDIDATNLYVRNSAINGLTAESTIAAANLNINTCDVNVKVLSYNWIPSTSDPLYNNGYPVINCSITNSKMAAQHILDTSKVRAVTKVIANWSNNIGYVPNVVYWDNSNTMIDPWDNHHVYTYKNNTGTMEMVTTVPVTHIYQVDKNVTARSQSDIDTWCGHPHTAIQLVPWYSRNSDERYVEKLTVAAGVYDAAGNDDLARCFCVANIFQLGVTGGQINMEVTAEYTGQPIWIVNSGDANKRDMVVYPDFNRGISHLAQRNHGATEYTPFMSLVDDYVYDYNVNAWKIRNINLGGYSTLTASVEHPVVFKLRQI